MRALVKENNIVSTFFLLLHSVIMSSTCSTEYLCLEFKDNESMKIAVQTKPTSPDGRNGENLAQADATNSAALALSMREMNNYVRAQRVLIVLSILSWGLTTLSAHQLWSPI
ncbi:hypothetical protein BTVI_39559 [Pitangus sulphuratus]|nr:hypothetical protein BTVI_39559 [Pitangus sulphuratus]